MSPPFREHNGYAQISKCVDAVGRVSREPLLFRGHATSDWTATPTVFRPGEAGISKIGDLKSWMDLAHRLITPTPSSYMEWLVLARHYGIATPLLDWTTNPLVAMFFACSLTGDEAVDKDDAVVVFTRRGLFTQIYRPEEIDVFGESAQPWIIDAATMNSRSSAQDSVLTLHSPLCKTLDVETLTTIPAHLKENTIWALQRFGIEETRIFADLAMAAQRFNQNAALIKFTDDFARRVPW